MKTTKLMFLIAALVFPFFQLHADDLESKQKKLAELKELSASVTEDLKKCEKQRKGWTAATVIGSLGVVGTAVGVGVQAKQLKNLQKDKKETEKSAQPKGDKK
jgi:hypothetical protein